MLRGSAGPGPRRRRGWRWRRAQRPRHGGGVRGGHPSRAAARPGHGRADSPGAAAAGDRVALVTMRAVCQRVARASVSVNGQTIARIGAGWAMLLGIGPSDTESVAAVLADKIAGLRVFEDEGGGMNLYSAAAGAENLVVSSSR